jgi:hypothetical protein
MLLTAVAGLTLTACTFLSGVEGLDLRRGGVAEGGSDFDATDDAATGRSDASSSGAVDATVPTGDAACATAAECQEQRCRDDVLVTDRIEAEIGKVLAVTATCAPGTPRVISPGPNHYYGADLRCTLAPQPTAAALSSFQTKMNADGWFGYSTQSAGADVVVVGMATTRLCSTY